MSHTDVTATPTQAAAHREADQAELRLLTAEEAAALARCSTRTVRRAYANGQLIAYRRRGSRAVLLNDEDVLDWARGEQIAPSRSLSRRDSEATCRPEPRRRPHATTLATGARSRFDLSAKGLLERRAPAE
jgi:excisionase family DNA binding protein